MSFTVFVDGGAGTTGLQIASRLARRPQIEVLQIDPAQRKNEAARRALLNAADIVILCLPDAAARQAVGLIDNDNVRVIDASSAHRTDARWTYGFCEMALGQGEKIARARRVSNPGCYPQGVIACLRPLIDAGIVKREAQVTVSGVSGYSGGGRAMITAYEQAGAGAAPFMPYGLTFSHKHLPEMTHYSGLARAPLFVPAVGPFAQGMITLTALHFAASPSPPLARDIHHCLDAYYGKGAGGLVRVAPIVEAERLEALNPARHAGTDFMHLFVCASEKRGHCVLAALYDNLGKGAAGAAMQNLALMLDLPPLPDAEFPV